MAHESSRLTGHTDPPVYNALGQMFTHFCFCKMAAFNSFSDYLACNEALV